ncbi:hypothetical protein BC834DRAFT_562274 [Gloeopeniophorella convolvens]|nr:hypothetical protein BC834DRAFT_562274 [Gloeopeniophorella convolvens]
MEEDVATAVAPEVVVRPPTPEPPVVSAASESVASHETLPKEQSDSKISSAEAHVTALISEDMPVPAPITADPTVPDPVPGDSTPASPASPVSLDFSTTSKLSAVPPALLRALELEGSRSDSSTSGLFTPAQRSEDSTPVPSEDGAAVPSEGAAEASAVLEDGEVQDEPAAPMSPQAEEGPPSVEHSTLVNEEGSTADERNSASHDDLPDLVLPDGADDDADEIGAAADDDDDIASTPRGGSVEPTVSESPIEEVKDITLPVEAAAEALPKEPGQPVDIPVTVDEEHAHSIVEGDEDADGEVDPDYSPAESAESVDKEDPFQFMGSKSKVAPGEVGNDEPESAEVSPDPEVSPATPTVDAAPREEEPEAAEREPEVVPNNATPAAQDEPAPAEEAVPDKKEPESPVEAETKADDEEEAPTRNLKRKWRDPNPAPARVTRSQSGVVAKGPGKKGKTSSRKKAPASKKGKPDSSAPAGDGDGDSIDDGASESASVSSGASTVYRLLASASRAGSVASTVSGDSPSTFASPIASRSRPIPSLIHSHGFLHHHHGAPPPPPPPPPPLVIPSTSNGQQSAPKSARTEAHSPVTTSEPSTPSLKRAPNVNSPVTRSNCRFHKISLPREEDGPRVFFIVPGCSLGDGELMEEEEIKDEGFSTNEDHMRMISNVEALELNPYLIGVVRQLVGVDLLREQQEIFYLPTEGEKVRRRRRKGAGAIESLRQLHRQSISSARPVLAREGSPRPSEASRGDAGSVRGENGAHTDNEGSALSNLNGDGEDDRSERPAKRRKRSADAEEGTSPAAASADGTQDASARPGSAAPEEKQPTASSLPPVVRRSKRKALNPDAAAYKPGQDDAEEEEEEVETRTRRGTRKGTKRSRTMEETLQSAPKAKRTRLRKTASAVAAAGAADS